MISCPAVSKAVVQRHYDLLTPFYRLLWGPHIHHGLWDTESASPRAAQLHLTDHLADLARLGKGDRVLDVGCGMGGSSIHLAKSRRCECLGVTISRTQRAWAAAGSWRHGTRRRARFQLADAEAVHFDPSSFDCVWSIECTEHLFDKPQFFQRAAHWLRPGGRIAVCAWLAGENLDSPRSRQLVYDVCDGFFCPSLGSREDYTEWLTDAGLTVRTFEDLTERVAKTWSICRERVAKPGIRQLASWINPETRTFLDRFGTILEAYESGAMQYGAFVAEKPLARTGG